MKQTTILIADDHTLIREAWSFILGANPKYRVVAECGNGEEALNAARQLRPNIVIMDINMPGIDGIEATMLIRKYAPGTKVIAVSLHTQPAYMRKMFKSGAMGYVTKNSGRQEMENAIEEVMAGKRYLCCIIKEILAAQTQDGFKKQQGLYALTSREIEIISLLMKGDSSKEIAVSLSIAQKTVEVHRHQIFRKLNLKNVVELVNFASVYQISA